MPQLMLDGFVQSCWTQTLMLVLQSSDIWISRAPWQSNKIYLLNVKVFLRVIMKKWEHYFFALYVNVFHDWVFVWLSNNDQHYNLQFFSLNSFPIILELFAAAPLFQFWVSVKIIFNRLIEAIKDTYSTTKKHNTSLRLKSKVAAEEHTVVRNTIHIRRLKNHSCSWDTVLDKMALKCICVKICHNGTAG